jgi:hypothetical protein
MGVMLVVAFVALASLLGGCGSSKSDGDVGAARASECPPVEARRAHATLSEADQARVLVLIAADADARQILGGTECELQNIGRWGDFGGAVELRFAEPESFPMQEWPLVDYRPRREPPYISRRLHLAAENVRTVMINVDLDRSRVVGIDPSGDEARITPGTDYLQHVKPPSGE